MTMRRRLRPLSGVVAGALRRRGRGAAGRRPPEARRPSDLRRGALDAHLHPRRPGHAGGALTGGALWTIAALILTAQPVADWPGYIVASSRSPIAGTCSAGRPCGAWLRHRRRRDPLRPARADCGSRRSPGMAGGARRGDRRHRLRVGHRVGRGRRGGRHRAGRHRAPAHAGWPTRGVVVAAAAALVGVGRAGSPSVSPGAWPACCCSRRRARDGRPRRRGGLTGRQVDGHYREPDPPMGRGR